MIYYVITKNAELVGVTYANAYTLSVPDVSIHEMDAPIPDLNIHRWDSVLENFVRVEGTSVYTKLQFLSKFTASERIGISASTDPVVIDIMRLLNLAEYIDVTSQDTINSVYYLTSIGLLTATRAQEILT